MKKRKHVRPGYRAFNGYVFKECDCEKYNRIQDRINKFMEEGRNIPEHLLNDSCMTFKIIINAL